MKDDKNKPRAYTKRQVRADENAEAYMRDNHIENARNMVIQQIDNPENPSLNTVNVHLAVVERHHGSEGYFIQNEQGISINDALIAYKEREKNIELDGREVPPKVKQVIASITKRFADRMHDEGEHAKRARRETPINPPRRESFVERSSKADSNREL